MNADEIRTILKTYISEDRPEAGPLFLAEIAAQLAELNARLYKLSGLPNRDVLDVRLVNRD